MLALGAPAGGHTAVVTVLQALPPDFTLPIVVMLHLAPDANGTVDMFRRLTSLAVAQVQLGAALTPHTVLLCPPRTFADGWRLCPLNHQPRR